MADIELVIKIPKEAYEFAKECKSKGSSKYNWNLTFNNIVFMIANGTPLPKEHGRLGDIDALEENLTNGINAGLLIEGYEDYDHINSMDDCVECVRYADTIIEADGEAE